MSISHAGLRVSEETKKKISRGMRGKRNSLGTKHAEEELQKQRMRRGEKGGNWRGGITPKNIMIRMSDEYKVWRDKVFKRDKYTCQNCGQIGGNKHAHHIRPFAIFPKLRLVVSNGITLCIPCHEKTETYKNRNKI